MSLLEIRDLFEEGAISSVEAVSRIVLNLGLSETVAEGIVQGWWEPETES